MKKLVIPTHMLFTQHLSAKNLNIDPNIPGGFSAFV